MMKKKKSFANEYSVEPSKNHQDENPDKRKPNPDVLYEERRPLLKEMPVTGGLYHPHNEEILDGIPR